MRRRITYANVTATLALVFAMSGGALAAKHYLITSTKQIKPSVLRKLKGKTGKTGATGKTGVTGAAGAAGAQGATGAEGNPHTTRWRTTVATAGASSTEPHTVVLATAGPFTVVGHCYLHESGGKNFTSAATYIRTSEAGSFAQGYSGEGSEQALEPNEDVQISEDTAEGLAETHEANYASTDDGSWGGENSNGTLALNGFGNQGVWLQGASGPACSFAGFLVVE